MARRLAADCVAGDWRRGAAGLGCAVLKRHTTSA